MRKIYNYILIACLASLVMACNAQQPQKKEEIKCDSTKSCRHIDVLPSIGTDKDEVLRSCPDHPWAEHRTYGPDDVHEIWDVKKMPLYPGGFQEMFKYLQNNINYPPQATIAHIEGRVIVAFIVEKDGSLADIHVRRSIHPSLDEEAVRVVSAMPNWIPGEEDGNPVRVKFVLPVTFSLKEK